MVINNKTSARCDQSNVEVKSVCHGYNASCRERIMKEEKRKRVGGVKDYFTIASLRLAYSSTERQRQPSTLP